jgi:hypothetical protein
MVYNPSSLFDTSQIAASTSNLVLLLIYVLLSERRGNWNSFVFGMSRVRILDWHRLSWDVFCFPAGEFSAGTVKQDFIPNIYNFIL